MHKILRRAKYARSEKRRRAFLIYDRAFPHLLGAARDHSIRTSRSDTRGKLEEKRKQRDDRSPGVFDDTSARGKSNEKDKGRERTRVVGAREFEALARGASGFVVIVIRGIGSLAA